MKNKTSQLPVSLVRDSLEIPFFQQARKMFDQFFDSNFADFNLCKSMDMNLYPRCDIVEFNDRLELELQIPGLNKDELNINISNGILTISGQKREHNQKKKEGEYIKRQIKRSKFTRSFDITNPQLDLDSISATFQNNILLIAISKKVKQEQNNIKTIEIK